MTMTVEAKDPISLLLPRELTDLILKYLQCDSRSLKSCSLVCKSWSIAAHSYLFRTLLVEDKNVTSVLATSATTSPYLNIISYVKCVELRHIKHISCISPQSIFCSISRTLTRMHLLRCHFNEFNELADAIQSFPCLRELSLDCVEWEVSGSDKTKILSHHTTAWSPSSINHLCLRHTRVSAILLLILDSRRPLHISRFEVGPAHEEDFPALAMFCHSIGKTVKYLELNLEEKLKCFSSQALPFGDWIEVQRHDSQIARLYAANFNMPDPPTNTIFNALETLRIDRFLDTFKRDSQYTNIIWTARILGKIDPPDLFKNLILQLVISRTGEIDECDNKWDFLDKALSSDVYVNFQFLEFEIVGNVHLDAVASLLSHRLPRLASCGRLQFQKRVAC